MTDCRLCRAEALEQDPKGLAKLIAFPNPVFEGHQVVMTAAHHERAEDVSPEEWQAVGILIGAMNARLWQEPGFERCYLLAIGDADDHQLHMHVVPRFEGDPPLGPHIFGPDGWIAGRSS